MQEPGDFGKDPSRDEARPNWEGNFGPLVKGGFIGMFSMPADRAGIPDSDPVNFACQVETTGYAGRASARPVFVFQAARR